jgi:DNA-directed RNA polymerase specialized sigma24 family protein
VPAQSTQDVAAETFQVAWRRLEAVPFDAAPWLYAVARRVLANERRAASRRAALPELTRDAPELIQRELRQPDGALRHERNPGDESRA